jgi:hypothetical protein
VYEVVLGVFPGIDSNMFVQKLGTRQENGTGRVTRGCGGMLSAREDSRIPALRILSDSEE